MPTYEYACKSCGKHTEVVQHISDEPLAECPHCGGPVRKVFHPAGILLKGSGFYKTDNRSKKSGSGTSESSKTPSSDTKSSSESKSSSSSDSSSGTKSGTKEKSA